MLDAIQFRLDKLKKFFYNVPEVTSASFMLLVIGVGMLCVMGVAGILNYAGVLPILVIALGFGGLIWGAAYGIIAQARADREAAERRKEKAERESNRLKK